MSNEKKKILGEYLTKYKLPDIVLNKININSFLTKHFAYQALRIGNSIGDDLDKYIEIIVWEEIAKKFNLIVDTTEHAELHTKGSTEKDLHILVQAALLFENIKNNKKRYKEILKNITDFIRKEANKMISMNK